MNAEAIKQNVELGLLSEQELKQLLFKKGIRADQIQCKNELIALYIKYIQPLPQRDARNKAKEVKMETTTSSVSPKKATFICSKQSIDLEEVFEKSKKRFMSSGEEEAQTSQQCDSSAQNSNSMDTSPSSLKRSHESDNSCAVRNSNSSDFDSGDLIKKLKFH